MDLLSRVMEAFRQRFGTPPWYVVRAPGRVNLIGEHTDYNDGFVLPMAIDRAVWIALSPLAGPYVSAYSLDFDGSTEFALNDLRRTASGWAEYLKGVAWALQEAGYPLHGWRGVLSGDVPIGAGLSSSAALEMAVARAFAAVSGWEWKPKEVALLCQRAENQWVGVNCGIMDQMISACGKIGHALLLDCRSLEGTLVPLPPATAVVIMDTATRRGLADSAYNERRAQCEAAARYFGVPALRDVTPDAFASKADGLDEVTRRRARHVITENARTLQACEAMQRGDAVQLGMLMQASHASLRDDFEVSSQELDVMVECALEQPACYGARMTGAGFGGCAVALVQAEAAQEFAARVAAAYQARTRRIPAVYISQAADGADVVMMPA
ncbi:MAG: galactokinase [Ardenticatenia bacterium]|jgi:galactokinase|nr:MAG: galactokinase [Ardenticatenia bacterium]